MSEALLSTHARAAGWLDRLDPRLRIVFSLAFALVAVSLSQLSLLLLATAGALLLALAAGIAPRTLLRRLMALEGFMLVLLLFLPFSVPGEVLLELGPLGASREGLIRALLILLKANAVVMTLLALLGTLEPVRLGHALARLRVPDKLVHLLLFTVRYIDLLYDEYRRLRLAMRARAFVARSDRHTWRSLGWLIGMLLVRSLERAGRVLDAMKCRGFHGRFYLLDEPRWHAGDSLFALGAGVWLALLLALEQGL